MATKKRGADTIPVTNDEEANALLANDPLALLLGMLLDQQVPMEWAFMGPHTLKTRLGFLDAAKIAEMDRDEFVEVCRDKPAIHRFPKSMGERVHAVCEYLVEHHDGNAEALWKGQTSAKAVYDRLRDLPGYGDEKTKIFLAILVKRFGLEFDGFAEVAAPFSDDQPRSVADISSQEAFDKVRAWKKSMKAKKKSKQD